MNSITLQKAKPVKGSPVLQGDFRTGCHAVLLAALAEGESRINNTPLCAHFNSHLELIKSLGYAVESAPGATVIRGHTGGPVLLPDPIIPENEISLFALGGMYSGYGTAQSFKISSKFITRMAGNLFLKLFNCEPTPGAEDGGGPVYRVNGLASPLPVRPELESLVKTGALFYYAASGAECELEFSEGLPEHVENLLAGFGAGIIIRRTGQKAMSELEKRIARKMNRTEKSRQLISLAPAPAYHSQEVTLPGDPSQAAVFILAAVLVPGSDILLENVLLSPSRTGFITNLKRMGAQVEVIKKSDAAGEPSGALKASASELKGRKFNLNSLRSMREEIPLLIIAAAFASGETIFRDIIHLREYESDLLKHIISTLKECGVEIGEIEDGLVVRGRSEYDGQNLSSAENPMIGFAHLIMALRCHGQSTLSGIKCMNELFPGTLEQLQKLAC